MTTKSDLLRHANESKARAERHCVMLCAGNLPTHDEFLATDIESWQEQRDRWQRMIELIEGMREDDLLRALEEEGNGIALVHDDANHWVVAGDGTQSIVTDGPKPFQTSYWIDEENIKLARKTPQDAIAAWIAQTKENSDD